VRNDSSISSRNPRPTSSCSFHIDWKCPSDLRSSEASPDRLLCLTARLLRVERAIYKVDSLHSTRSARLPWHTQDRRCEAVVAETVASIRNLHEQCGLGRADWHCGPRSVVLVIPFFGTKVLVIPFFGTKSNSYSIILTIIELCWPRYEALTRPFELARFLLNSLQAQRSLEPVRQRLCIRKYPNRTASSHQPGCPIGQRCVDPWPLGQSERA